METGQREAGRAEEEEEEFHHHCRHLPEPILHGQDQGTSRNHYRHQTIAANLGPPRPCPLQAVGQRHPRLHRHLYR